MFGARGNLRGTTLIYCGLTDTASIGTGNNLLYPDMLTVAKTGSV